MTIKHDLADNSTRSRSIDSRVSRRQLMQLGTVAAATVFTGVTASTATATQATPEATSATDERIQSALDAIDRLAGDLADAGAVPGFAISVVSKDDVVYAKGFGVRSVDAPDVVDETTVFQIASVSKTLAATTVAALVGDELVSWDDRIEDLLPGFELSDPWVTRHVTIRDCFSHRTGMHGTAGDDLEAMGFSRDEIIDRMRYLPLTGEFRQSYSYSNFGLTAGAEAAASSSGLSWEDLAEQRLYQPLGMTSTSSRYADFMRQDNRTTLHAKIDGSWKADVTRQPDPQSPAGGVSTNVVDLAQWVRLLLANGSFDGDEKISPTALEETHTPQIVRGRNRVTGATAYYGLGWNIDYGEDGRISWSHAGAFSQGAQTYVHLIPSEQLGIVVLSNAFPTGVPEGIAATFFDLVLHGTTTRDWIAFWNGLYDQQAASFETAGAAYAVAPASPEPALDAASYIGTYRNDYFGDLTVVGSAGDALTLNVGPTGSYPLKQWDRDLFLYEASPEFPGVMSAATFVIDPSQRAERVVLDGLDTYGLGTFVRVD